MKTDDSKKVFKERRLAKERGRMADDFYEASAPIHRDKQREKVPFQLPWAHIRVDILHTLQARFFFAMRGVSEIPQRIIPNVFDLIAMVFTDVTEYLQRHVSTSNCYVAKQLKTAHEQGYEELLCSVSCRRGSRQTSCVHLRCLVHTKTIFNFL